MVKNPNSAKYGKEKQKISLKMKNKGSLSIGKLMWKCIKSLILKILLSFHVKNRQSVHIYNMASITMVGLVVTSWKNVME